MAEPYDSNPKATTKEPDQRPRNAGDEHEHEHAHAHAYRSGPVLVDARSSSSSSSVPYLSTPTSTLPSPSRTPAPKHHDPVPASVSVTVDDKSIAGKSLQVEAAAVEADSCPPWLRTGTTMQCHLGHRPSLRRVLGRAWHRLHAASSQGTMSSGCLQAMPGTRRLWLPSDLGWVDVLDSISSEQWGQ